MTTNGYIFSRSIFFFWKPQTTILGRDPKRKRNVCLWSFFLLYCCAASSSQESGLSSRTTLLYSLLSILYDLLFVRSVTYLITYCIPGSYSIPFIFFCSLAHFSFPLAFSLNHKEGRESVQFCTTHRIHNTLRRFRCVQNFL